MNNLIGEDLPKPGSLPFKEKEQIAKLKLHLLLSRYRSGIRFLSKAQSFPQSQQDQLAIYFWQDMVASFDLNFV
jgi:hypothetical protein